MNLNKYTFNSALETPSGRGMSFKTAQKFSNPALAGQIFRRKYFKAAQPQPKTNRNARKKSAKIRQALNSVSSKA
ncbi:hypothetical protein ACX8XP_03390 [Calditrichota bacterium LG25]